MRVHLPRPLHGWRAFAGEVGIIVLGVLIALAAGQLAESINDEQRAKASMSAINLELAHAAGVYEERTFVQPCLEKRLSLITSILSDARRSGKIPDIGEIGVPPVRPVPFAAWNEAITEGTLSHFPKERRDQLSMLQAQASSYSGEVENEREMWAMLRVLEHQRGPIDANLAGELSLTVERLRFRNWLNGINAEQLLSSVIELKVTPDFAVLSDTAEDTLTRRDVYENIQARPVCKALPIDEQARN